MCFSLRRSPLAWPSEVRHFRDTSIAMTRAVAKPFGTSLTLPLAVPAFPFPFPPAPPEELPALPPPLEEESGQACHEKIAGSSKELASQVTGGLQQTVFLLSAVAAMPALVAALYVKPPKHVTDPIPPHLVSSASQHVVSSQVPASAAPPGHTVSAMFVFFFLPAEHVKELHLFLAEQQFPFTSLPTVLPALVEST